MPRPLHSIMKLQRIMIDGGFSCPNRDGHVGLGGCTYCRNDAFAPAYCRQNQTITQQIQAGKQFFAHRYPHMQYLAYFQSYSGTYAPIDVLRQRYDEALSDPDVVGLVIATRPDCLSDEVLDLLQAYAQRVSLKVEVGVESFCDATLQRIHRGHDSQCAQQAIHHLAQRGIQVGVHLILGLPGESREQMLDGARLLAQLPVQSLKLHQLQILEGTPMAEDYRLHPAQFVTFPTASDYISLVRQFVSLLPSTIQLERIVAECPPHILIAPRWGLKPAEVERMLREN